VERNFPAVFFILQAQFSLAQVATKKQNLLDEQKYEREG
jgi:hypothetical protein